MATVSKILKHIVVLGAVGYGEVGGAGGRRREEVVLLCC